MKKILVTTSTFCQFSKEPIKLLEKNDIKVSLNSHNRKLTESELLQQISKFDGVIAGTENYNKNVINEAKKLKVISRIGVGLDNIDLNYVKTKNISVFRTQTTPALAVSELVLGLMIDLMRKITNHSIKMSNNIWDKQMGSLLNGKTLGIIGLGTIGKKLVEVTKGFNFNYLAYDLHHDINFSSANSVKYCNLEELLKSSDIVSIHLNMSNQNNNLINLKELKAMKSSSILINTSRGEIVNEKDLEIAIKESIISGAALDVFKNEPYTGSLNKYNNIILTPHIGAYAKELRIIMELEAVNNLLTGLENL